MKKITLSIAGMTCSACSNGLEKYLNKQDGVEEASVNLVMNSADVSYDEQKIKLEDIERFIKEAGFKSLGKFSLDNEENDKKKEIIKIITVSLIAIFSMIIMMFYMYNLFGTKAFAEANPVIYVGSLFLLCTIAIILGFGIIKNGIINLIHKMPNMDSLITIRSFSELYL
jgi:Cu+-exporting ATPase